MQPMKPEEVDRILTDRKDVTRDHVDEYQRLVAKRFDVNPHISKTSSQTAEHAAREQRLRELHHLIFE
jgi:peptidase E